MHINGIKNITLIKDSFKLAPKTVDDKNSKKRGRTENSNDKTVNDGDDESETESETDDDEIVVMHKGKNVLGGNGKGIVSHTTPSTPVNKVNKSTYVCVYVSVCVCVYDECAHTYVMVCVFVSCHHVHLFVDATRESSRFFHLYTYIHILQHGVVGFDLDTICMDGRVALLYTSPSAPPEVWYQDLSCTWYYVARSFSDYFRLLIMHLGLPHWQSSYTDTGMDPVFKVLQCMRNVYIYIQV